MDDFVATQAINTYYANCKSYTSAYKKTSSGSTYTYRKWFGHLCTSKSLQIQLKFKATEKTKMSGITTQHKDAVCVPAGTYVTCTYTIKGGQENQLGIEFPLSAPYFGVVKATFI